MVYKLFFRKKKKSEIKRVDTLADAMSITTREELANELHKQVIKKFQNCKVYSSFMDDI